MDFAHAVDYFAGRVYNYFHSPFPRTPQLFSSTIFSYHVSQPIQLKHKKVNNLSDFPTFSYSSPPVGALLHFQELCCVEWSCLFPYVARFAIYVLDFQRFRGGEFKLSELLAKSGPFQFTWTALL